MKKALLLLASVLLLTSAATAADKVYELRIYTCNPGKLDALNARFRDHTVRLFEKHGIENVGYWTPIDNTNNQLVYIIAHKSREAAKASFAAFGADPDWKAAAKASEANGKILAKAPESIFMDATDYSPVPKKSGGTPRVFEWRTYVTPDGGLGNLNARFRDHTVKLFEKHGMANIFYGVPQDEAKGSKNTLQYIIAFKDKAAATASWAAFQKDPTWTAAKKASEDKAGGSLTIKGGVKSVFMVPTDYSPIK
jgi:uncharacterized protein (DUF1330 family)